MLDTPEGREAFTKSLIEKVKTLPKSEHKPATVVAVNADATLTVHVDGDESSVTVNVQHADITFAEGDRVLILFEPPRVAVALCVIAVPA